MELNIISIIIGGVSLIVGTILGKVIFAKNTNKIVEDAKAEAKKLISEGQFEADRLKKEKLLEAKEKFVQMKSDHDKDVLQRTQKLSESENKIKQKSRA